MRTKHTNGQWKQMNLTIYTTIQTESGNEKIMEIASIDPKKGQMSDENLANAQLIASAPELLEALQHLLKSHRQLTFEKNHSLNDNWLEEKAQEIINKATK
jgi:transcription initiation factor IIE alpha subunit